MKTRTVLVSIFLASLALLLLMASQGTPVAAQRPKPTPTPSARADDPVPGTSGYLSKTITVPRAMTNIPLQRLRAFNLRGSYVAAGVGMRNRGFGTISISGIPSGSQVKTAYLYWSILANANTPAFAQGKINNQPITGVLIGAGGDPCWGNSNNFAYRADVTTFVQGNGNYSLSGFASGKTDGSDPWTSGSARPMIEGASLVVVYENASSPQTQVMIYDGSFETHDQLVSLTLDGFTASSPVSKALTTFIGADGQDAGEPGSTFNGNTLPSVGWDGNDPQAGNTFSHGNLWDTMTLDVTSLVSPGSTSATATVQGGPDCLVWVAQVFAALTAPPPPPSGKQVVILVHGWGAFDKQIHCSDGITKYPNNQNFRDGNDPLLGDMPDWLERDGFEVWSAHLETGPDFTPTLSENAKCLSDQIEQVRNRAPDGKVILIAHSMGGLVSRAYLEDDNLYQNDVKILFTLGSPHLGEPDILVELIKKIFRLDCNTQQALCEFKAKAMEQFNRRYSNRRPDVDYYVVGGDTRFFAMSWIGWLFNAALPDQDDGIVPTSSSLGLNNIRQSLRTSEAHIRKFWGLNFALYTYFTPPPGDLYSFAYGNCIQPVLKGDPNGCRSSSTQSLKQASDPSFTALVPVTEGIISSGQKTTQTVSLDGGGSALFGASWVTGTVAFTLTSASGQTIDPAYALVNPSQVSYLQSSPGETPLGASYTITSPLAGVWTMNLQAGSVPAGSTNYTLLVAMASPITLTTQTDRSWYSAGQSATITGILGGGVTASSVQAEIQRPDQAKDTLTLISQGGGIYRGSYIVPGLPGYVTVRVIANGIDGAGRAFSRQAVTSFQIASSVAALSNSYSDRPEDIDGNGRYEGLAVDIGVTANVIGTFSIAADLVSSANNALIARSATSVLLAPGSQTVTLRFNGETIRASGVDGPYRVTSVLLMDNRGAALPVQEASNVWTTAAYNHSQFGNDFRFYMPIITR